MLLAAAPVFPQTSVQQGDVGAYVLSIHLHPNSEDGIEGVSLAHDSPYGLSLDDGGRMGPLSLLPGQTHYFSVDFSVLTGNPGAIPAVFNVTAAEPYFITPFGADNQTLSVIVITPTFDTHPPETQLSFSLPNYTTEDGRLYASSNTTFGFVSTDTANGSEPVSGVQQIEFRVDDPSGPFAVFASSFALVEGEHLIEFRGVDQAGNYEAIRSSAVYVDATPPHTGRGVIGPSAFDALGRLVISSSTRLALYPNDPAPGGVSAGVGGTFVLIDRTPEQCNFYPGGTPPPPYDPSIPFGRCGNRLYQAPFKLTTSTHTVYIRSHDRVGNKEVWRSTSIVVDASPPSVTISSPSGGEGFSVGQDSITVSFTVSDDYDPTPSSSAWLAEVEDAGILNPAGLSSMTVAAGQIVDPALLDDGVWELRVSAVDFVQNSSVVTSGRFEVIRDILPPQTSLVLGQPSVSGNPSWVKSTTLLTLEAVDDAVAVGDGRGLGVARTSYSMDSPAATLEYSSAGFHLSGEGSHYVAYRSVDVLGHAEEVKVSSVSIDETPPSIAFTQPAANAVLNTETPAIRVVHSDAGSGIDTSAFTIQIDGLNLSVLPPSQTEANVTLPSVGQGSHTVTASIADRLGNRQSVSLSFFVDSLSPQATITRPSDGSYVNLKRPTIEGVASDYGSGLNTSSITMSLDGGQVSAQIASPGGPGIPGPWTETRSLPTGLWGQASAVWNGYLYVAGGGGSFPGYSAEVKYAAINADGTLGAWQTGPSMPRGLTGHKMVATQGRLFVLGGLTAANVSYNEAYVSVIDPATGQPGAWAPSRPLLFSNGAVSPGATVVGNFIYVMGGYNPYCQVNSQVYYAQICPENSTGLCTSWNTTSPLPTTLDQMDAVSVDGVLYIYAPGGVQYGCSNTPTNRVYSAKQNPNGTLTAWTAGANMRRAVARYVGLGAEGHIYVLGGTSYADPVATVDFAEVNAQTGAIGEWTEDAKYNLPIPLMSGSGAVWDGRLFVLGGQTTGGTTNKIYYSQVRSAGIITVSTATYTPAGDLAEGEHTVTLSAADKAGNLGQAQASRFNVDTLPPTLSVSIDGRSPGSDKFWVNVARPQIVVAYSDPGGAIPGSGVDVASLAIGIDGVDVTASAEKDASGARYTPQSDFSQNGPHALAINLRDRAGNAAYLAAQFYVDSLPPQVAISTPAGNIYLTTSTVPMASVSVDGGSGLSTDTVKLLLNGTTLAATLSFIGGGGGQGIPEPWQTAGSLPDRLWGHASAVWNGFVYVSGGGNTSAYQSAVRYAPIQGDGGIGAGSWQSAPSMARGLTGHKMVAAQGRIFTLGGLTGANVSYNEVYVATINVNGSLSNWSPSESLGFPYGTVSMGVAVLGDYIYAMGGYNPYCQVFAQVYYAKICPQKASGLCGPWQATTPLPTTLDQMDAVTVDGALYIYVPGGVQNGCSNSPTNRVWYGKPNKDTGAVAQWNETAILPRAVSKYVGLGAEGHIYVLGGTPSVNPVNTVDFAAINQQTGALEPWTEDARYSLPVPLHSASGVVWEGRLYVMGGQPGDGTISNTIYSSLVGKGTVISATAAYTASVAEGQYSLQAQARDLAGNIGSQDAAFTADWTPPVSNLVVEGPSRTYQGRTYIPGQSVMRIGASDAVAGIKESRLKVDFGNFTVTAGTFTLAQGDHDLTFYSIDRANNAEAYKTAAVKADGIAPAAAADLLAVAASTTGLTLTWTSPGDDGVEGTILSGEFRVQYASLPTSFDPGQAQIVESVINQSSGTAKSLRIDGLAPGTDYTFALWTKDTAGNYSAAATVSARTLSQAQSVDQVASIISPEPLLTVSTVTPATAAGPLSVSTTQGLGTLTPTFYELNTGSTEPVHFSTPAVLSFIFDRTGVELDQVAIFKYMDVGGGVMAWSSAPIVNQTLTQLSDNLYQISGQIYSASLYSVFEKRDILPPRTTLALGEPKYVAGETYLTAATELSLSAVDDRNVVGDGDGAGVSGTQYALDGGAAALYTAPVRLSGEGPHDFAFFSVDLKNNLEARQSRRLVVDGTPPATTVSLSTPSFEAFVSPLTTVKLSAQDPPAGTVPGSGLSKLLYAVGAGQLGQGPLEFGLQGPDGKYDVNYQAQDNLGNLEVLQKKTYSLDSTPAVSVADIGAHSYSAPDGKKYVSPLTSVTLSAEDQIVNEVASGVQFLAVDLGQGYAPYTAPLTFTQGQHQIQYRATDKVGNVEQGKALELYVDGTAPATLLSYDGYHLPRAETTLPPAEAEMFIMPQTKLILTAQDPGEIASGVGSTEYRIDEGAWLAYSAPFSITADGLHTLAWRSKDRVDNEEIAHSLKIAVIGDILPPRTAMQVGEPKYIASRDYVTSRTELTLSAIDDRLAVGDGLGVGVERTEYTVDEGASTRYSAPVKLSGEGPHAVGFFSADLLGHVETAQSRSLTVDDAPPATLVSLSTPSFGAYVSPLTTVKLSAQDPAAGTVPGSGLAKLLYAVGPGPLAEGVLEFGLVGPDGKYELNYQAQDNLGNLEPLRKNTYSLDSTPPLSASAIGAHSYQAPDGKLYVSPVSQVALSATDPLVNEVASGIKLIEADLGQGYAPYTVPLTFAAGHRQIQFRAMDNVGNIEQAKALELYVDGTVPVTAISYDGFHLTRADNPGLPPAEAEEFISPQTKVILTAQDPGAEFASGVKVTEYRLDDGNWVAYSVPFSITAEGLHTLAWRSKDQVDNEETAHSLKIAVMGDIQPPRTVMSIGAPKYVAADTYLTSATELTLTAVDDRLSVGDGLGLGVEKTEYSLDAGVLARYAAPIKLSGNGPHDVAFFSTDVLGHAEASQSRRLLVDDAPPITEIVLSGLRFTAQSGDPNAVGGPLFIASTTLTALQAQDPLMNGSASGLASLSYGLDTTALGPYSAAFTVTQQGVHALKYLAVDNLGNAESLKTLSFSVDAAPPLTQISFNGPYFMQGVNSGAVPPEAEVFIARETRIVLTAHDPVVAETASGVGEIRYRLNGGAWQAYSQSLAILSGGLHTLEWYAKDRLGLEEAVHSLRIAVDVAAPISSLSIGEPKFLALGLDFVTPQTPIALSAVDLPNSGVAVGVQGISYRIDAGAELLYTASFTLAQGTHTIEFWAYDRAGNVEYRQSRLLTSTLLQTAALTGVDGITGSGTAQVTGKLLSNGRVAISGSVRVLGDAAGSPVALTGNASVSGIVSQNGAGTMPEPIDLALAEQSASAASSNALIPAAFLKNDVLVVTGNKTLLLATGTYVLKGLTLSGGASLDVAGPVRLFLDGPLQVSGGATLNAGGTASSLVLFAKSGSIALSGGAQAVGLFYAPRSALGISGNARIGGALFAKSVAITGDSNVIAAGEVLPPELIASGGTPGKGGKTADFSAGGILVAQGAADPSFQLRDLYAFPNPAVGGAKPVIHAAVGIADRVVVKIFDVSGRQAKEATLDGTPQIVDDGSGPKYAYEFTWDGHIPSGVYFYTIEAEKSGQKIRKAGKLSVVR